METDERTVAEERGEEELHHDRLMALLHDLVRKNGGRRGAARVRWESTDGRWARAWTGGGCPGG